MAKRILFIDVLRGIGILGVLISHAALYGVYYGEENALRVLPETAILFLIPIIILITWTGLFAIITGLVNAFTVYNRLERGVPLGVALGGPLVNATLVYILHIIYRILFNHSSSGIRGEELHSIITGWVETLKPVKFDIMQLYLTEALHMIAVTGWFTTFLLWLLWRKGGHKRVDRNYRILLIVSVLWLAFYSPIFNLFRPVFEDWYYRDEFRYYVLNFVVMKAFFGGLQVLLPYGGFGTIGIIYGTWFASGTDFQVMYKFSKLMGLIFVLSGIGITIYIFGYTSTSLEQFLEFKNLPPTFTWFNLGTMLWFISWLIYVMEDRTTEERLVLAKKTMWIRQFGVLALTVFFFESLVHALFSKLFHSIFGEVGSMNDAFMFNPPAIILYFLTIFIFWGVLLYFWRKAEFMYSLEWFFVKLANLFRKAKSSRGDLYAIFINPLGKEGMET